MNALLPFHSPKVPQSDPSSKLKTKEGGLVLEEGLEQRRGSRCCAFPAARFKPSLSLSAPADPTLPRVMGLPVQATVEQPLSSASTIAL